jgi:hypothetical protein
VEVTHNSRKNEEERKRMDEDQRSWFNDQNL